MRRDDNDACGAIPRKRGEWPELSADEIKREQGMPRIEKVPEPAQMARAWNYAPERAGNSRFKESRYQASQSSGSQPPQALQSREQRHWRRNVNTNAGWRGTKVATVLITITVGAEIISTGNRLWSSVQQQTQTGPRAAPVTAGARSCRRHRSTMSLFLQTVRAALTK